MNTRKTRYIRVFEQHKSGTLHVHMLIDFAPHDLKKITRYNRVKKRHETIWNSATISKALNQLGLGYIYDYQPVAVDIVADSASAEERAVRLSGYITKYLTKTIQEVITIANREHKLRLRAIQTSQSWWDFEKETSEYQFSIGVLTLPDYLENIGQNKTNYDINKRAEIEIEEFAEQTFYPNPDTLLLDIAEDNDL